MSFVAIVMIGNVEGPVADAIASAVSEAAAVSVERAGTLPEPEYAWDERRGQYSSTAVLGKLVENCPAGAFKVLGITERDLFIPMLSFVFGQAQVGGRGALLSLARLRQEFYGLPPQVSRFHERARKEALHELGHTFGLVHCPETSCVMSLATNLRQLDLKGAGYCASCRAMLGEAGPLENHK
jgi:archaemetzincin